MRKVALFLFGMGLGGLGLLLSGFSVIALLDPVGTKMADDADPFGPIGPEFYVWSVFLLLIGLLLIGAAGFTLVKVDKKS